MFTKSRLTMAFKVLRVTNHSWIEGHQVQDGRPQTGLHTLEDQLGRPFSIYRHKIDTGVHVSSAFYKCE